MDDCRIKYLRWLRAPERRTVKSEADQAFTQAKTELIAIRVREKKRELMETDQATADMELVIGAFLSKLSSIAPRIGRAAGNSLLVRKEIDAIVFEARKDLADLFNKFADERGEPPAEAPTTDDTGKDEFAS